MFDGLPRRNLTDCIRATPVKEEMCPCPSGPLEKVAEVDEDKVKGTFSESFQLLDDRFGTEPSPGVAPGLLRLQAYWIFHQPDVLSRAF